MSTPSQPPNATNAKPSIETRSAHNVQLWINQGTAEGRLKKCWNLGIDMVDPQKEIAGETRDAGDSFFVPSCVHHSFESDFAGTDDDTQLHILRYNLSNDPVSCPKNCTYYRNRKWGWVQSNTRKTVEALFGAARDLLKSFAGLAWQTQVALIGMVVLIIAPKWVPLIITLAKAIWGKTP